MSERSDGPMSEAAIRAALHRHRPDLDGTPVARLRTGGSAFAVGPDLIVRAGDARRQAAVLAVAADRSTVPVPAPVFVDAEHDVLGYRRIEGVPLPNAEITAFGASLGAFLSRLHGTYVGTIDRVVPVSPDELDDPALRLAATHERRRRMHADLSVAARALIDRSLAVTAPAAAGHRSLCHLDLTSAHILMHPATGELTGVLDWADAAIGDPARDFAVMLVDLGALMYDVLVAGYRGGVDAEVHERAVVFARCLLLERIECGLATGDRSAAQDALRRLQRLVA